MCKRIWDFLKRIVARVLHLFRSARMPSVSDVPKTMDDSHVRAKHLVLPNMPKRQPSDKRHGWKRRIGKTLGGAEYYCNKCRASFFVAAH